MNEAGIRYEAREAVAVITIERAQARNALDRRAFAALGEAFRRADADAAVACVVLTNAGDKVFCAGADLDDVRSLVASGDALALDDACGDWVQLSRTMRGLGKPILGVARGDIIGAGLGVAMMCDILVLREDAHISLPERKLGLFPLLTLPLVLRTCTNPRRLWRMILLDERLSAREAERLQLVDMALPEDRLDHEIAQMTSRLSTWNPSALRVGRRSYDTALSQSTDDAMAVLQPLMGMLVTSHESRRRLAAFFGQKAPA
jgi:enoyl-CoA hydratase/carnithine racemase